MSGPQTYSTEYRWGKLASKSFKSSNSPCCVWLHSYTSQSSGSSITFTHFSVTLFRLPPPDSPCDYVTKSWISDFVRLAGISQLHMPIVKVCNVFVFSSSLALTFYTATCKRFENTSYLCAAGWFPIRVATIYHTNTDITCGSARDYRTSRGVYYNVRS